MTTTTSRIDTITSYLESCAHTEYGHDLHELLADGHAARGLIEDACYWHGWQYTPQFLADVLTAARARADELAEEAAWDAAHA